MAVPAQYLAHAFRHDPGAIRPALDDATGVSSVFLGDAATGGGHLLAQMQPRGDNTVFSGLRSERSCKNNNDVNNGCFVPRKRARVGDDAGACGLIMEEHGHRGALLLPPVTMTQAAAGDVPSREQDSGPASTSGRLPASAVPVVSLSQGLLSQLHRHGIEIDSLVRGENERLRAGLEAARRRHVRAVVSALERAAARRLRAAEADLQRALMRGAELEERLREMVAEGQAWQGIANIHEAAASGLRSTLDQLLQQPTPAPCVVAEDAQSCCFEEQDHRAAYLHDGPAATTTRACKSCGEAGACVLVLPCRHLCLCAGCEAGADECPVCGATKNASLHVLLS